MPKNQTLQTPIITLQLSPSDPYSPLSAYGDQVLFPDYSIQTHHVYLWPIVQNGEFGLPTRVITPNTVLPVHIKAVVPHGVYYTVQDTEFRADFYTKSLFDTLHLRFEKKLMTKQFLPMQEKFNMQELFKFFNEKDPLRNKISVHLYAKGIYDIDKTSVYLLQDEPIFYSTTWKRNTATFRTKNLGKFTLLNDTQGPRIQPKIITNKQIRVRVLDDLSGIDRWEATLNNNWLLMEYNNANKELTAKPRSKNTTLKGKLSIIVYDRQNNISFFNYKIL